MNEAITFGLSVKETVLTSIFLLLLLSPFLLIGLRKNAERTIRAIKYIAIFAGFYCLWDLIYLLPSYFKPLRFVAGQMNWESKLLGLGLGILFIIFFKGLSLPEYGLTFKQERGSLRSRFLIVLILCLVIGGALHAFFGSPRETFSWENVWFEFSMPGIEEELIVRGILLALLNKAYQRKFSLGGARFGWGLINTSLLFGMLHGLHVNSEFQVTFQPITVLLTSFMGFWFGWIREKTGSLVLPMAMHNLTNTINSLIVMLK